LKAPSTSTRCCGSGGAGGVGGPAERRRLGELFRHRDFPHFLQNFKQVCGELRRPEDFGIATAALSGRLRDETVRYAEVFCSPTIFARAGLPVGEIMEAIAVAARRGEAEGGPQMRFLFDGVRQFGSDRSNRWWRWPWRSGLRG